MMMQPPLAIGSKKSSQPDAECAGSADGNISSVCSRATVELRTVGFSVVKRGCLLLLMTGFLWGCAAAPIKQVQPMTELQPPAFMAAEAPQPTTEGSLWQENVTMGELFVNPKARRVGDIVTIKIIESSKASNNATTNTGRDSSFSLGLANFLGLENESKYSVATGFNPFSKIAGSGTTQFSGTGGTTRSGDLNAYITTRVIGVLPSGNLAISGSREIIVNNETQLIVVTGVIRSRDISSENVVLSTYISDARIAYSGSGIVNDQQRKGWLSNVLDVVSPF
jgi:flagellar L-ring protein precursor FlgH